MLQISQTENPMCSATIDQMRLRRAMTLPLVFQNVSSSAFQSEIQAGFEVGFGVLIGNFLSEEARHRHRGIGLEDTEARSGEAPVRRCHKSDDWFSTDGINGVSTKLFKLRARLLPCKI